MKKLFSVSLLALLFISAAPSLANAQCALQGCFGACGGSSFEDQFTAEASGSYSVNITNSLCGSQGVTLVVTVGHRHIARHLEHADGPVVFAADAGEVVTVSVENWKTDTDIVCIWQGEVHVTVCPNF
jgi:hypothetical protein